MLQEKYDNTDFFVFNAVCSLFIHIHVVLEELYFDNYLWERENSKQFCNQIFNASSQNRFLNTSARGFNERGLQLQSATSATSSALSYVNVFRV